MHRVAVIAAGAWLVAAAVGAGGCGHRAIPARGDAAGPERFLTGGKVVFEDDFERAELGEGWQVESPDWKIVGGWLHSTRPENKGAWLMTQLPKGSWRVEFLARSEPLPDGSFPGDLKCEVAADKPEHQGGYIVINGGWNNSLDVIARKDEHGKDRLAQAAAPVKPSVAYKWAIVKHEGTLYWFRDGELLMTYADDKPIDGRYFGFNNWATQAYFDALKIYALSE
ncbi:MAG: hypothetical protein KC635_04165 [Myxococcales bacterium]|nr:hypothetical protein [Myxococcales bacterium]MCB9733511.1 hypothetical protein [Deltaproteobacteria bacterium]